MITPSLSQIDSIRTEGFRPQVVGCFINSKKLFMFYQKQYEIWQFPQGGVDNKESIEDAIAREMTEELGAEFFKLAIKSYTLLGSNSVKFPPQNRGTRKLETDDGQPIQMRGKWYYFIAIPTTTDSININQTEFDDYKLLSHSEAFKLAGTIYQKGKMRVTMLAIDLIKQHGLIE